MIRLQVALPDALGTVSTSVDVAERGEVAAGDARHYELWYRDPVNGPCGLAFNLSNRLSIVGTE